MDPIQHWESLPVPASVVALRTVQAMIVLGIAGIVYTVIARVRQQRAKQEFDRMYSHHG